MKTIKSFNNNFLIQIKKHPKMGRGVFSLIDLKKGSLVEVSELIILSKKDTKIVLSGLKSLAKFLFTYNKEQVAIALGVGSLFNHSNKPNIEYIFKNKKLYFITNKSVKAGEQLFINYGYEPLKYYFE